MKTLIVGRTVMGSSRCIGGLCEDGSSIRLLDSRGRNWPVTTPFQLGQIWDLTFSPAANLRPPHVEDVIVTSSRLVGTESDPRGRILAHIKPWRGPASVLFDGGVAYTGNCNGYISESGGIPDRSTWFWIPDKVLALRDDRSHYDYPSSVFGVTVREGLSYKGEPPPPPTIPAGALVRVSLARWWRPDPNDTSFPERCFVQLSGWF